jgi:hypothetical protein
MLNASVFCTVSFIWGPMIEGWDSATDSERIACGEARDAGQSQKQRIESRW